MLTAKLKMVPRVHVVSPRPVHPSSRSAHPLGLGIICVLASLGVHGLLLQISLNPQPSEEAQSVEVEPQEPVPEIFTVARVPEVAPEVLEITAEPVPPAETAIAPSPVASATPSSQNSVEVPRLAELTSESDPSLADPGEPPEERLPVPVEPEPEATPYGDFPHLEGATSCQGVESCWRSPTNSWRSTTQTLRSQLEEQGYQLNDITDQIVSVDSGVKIFAVVKNGAPEYYLNLVSVSEAVLYAMTEEPMTQADLDEIAQ